MEKFIGGDDRVASPIEKDDLSELDILPLSLPDSFDDSMSLDMYKDFISQSRHDPKRETASMTECPEGSRAARNDEQQERKPHQHDAYDRRSDALEKRSAKNEAESLCMQLNNQILEYRRQVHLMGIDLERARNESEVFLTRAERAEKDRETSDDALKHSQQTYEKEISRINAEREETKLRCDREISRLREGCNHDIASSRCHQNEAFIRESNLLRDARDRAIEQTKTLQHELCGLRSDRGKKDEENMEIIIELEKQIADVRSDLKVKSCELNTLQACQDRTIAEATKSKEESIYYKEALALLQQGYSKLERRADRSEEAICLKDAELQVYRHDDLLVDCGFDDAEPNGEDCLSGRRSLMRNSVALARKCRELQSTMKKLSEELSTEREKNSVLSRKEEANQRLFQELSAQGSKNASAYIISTVKARDTEILRLSSDITSLQMNLNKVAQERDELSSKLAKVLERRDQLDEMKALVKSMRNASMANSVLPRDDDNRAAAGRTGIDEDPEIGDEDDLLDHMIHRSFLTLPIAN
jgi:hypothetical protein